jgi:hypothetical protein
MTVMGEGFVTISMAMRGSVSWKGREARRAVESRLDHVFVIAGPSGSGKSTFMREFVFDRLPRTISDDLPHQSKAWLRTSGNELSRKGLAGVLRGKDPTPGLIVHYDIMRAHTRGFGAYASDPAMQAVTEARAALTVLTILPPRIVLFEQYIKRARNGEFEEWWDQKRLLRPLKRKLRAAFHRVTGRSPRLLKAGDLTLLSVYGSDNGLEHWTRRWESFLDGVRRDRHDVRLVYVAPEAPEAEPGSQDFPRFRLLRRV